MNIFKPLVASLVLCLVNAMIPNANATQITAGKLASVRYVVVSQRWLTTDELKQFDDEFGLAIAVRIRLSNESRAPVYYLADGNGSIQPQGYEFFRNVGETKWDYSPPTRGRAGSPGMEPVSRQYTYLILPPGAAIEVEVFDWSRSGQEHAFSTFVRFDVKGMPIEIVSDTFRPLSDR
jgi:hypothetical protein